MTDTVEVRGCSRRDKPVDLTPVTELPHHLATREQLAMMVTRYEFAREHCVSRDVLEVACGAGTGLGYLAQVARRIVAGDITTSNVAIARTTYAGTKWITLCELDAHALPFPSASFDVVILFDALYFLQNFEAFLLEARRVLRDGGRVLLSTVNVHWAEFNPSPYATRYYDGAELTAMLERSGFSVRQYGAFSVQSEPSLLGGLTSIIRMLAIKLHLIPTNVRGKEFLKRLFYGRLHPFGPRISENAAPAVKRVPIDGPGGATGDLKILYFVGVKAHRSWSVSP